MTSRPIPPMATQDTWTALMADPLPVEEVTRWIAAPSAGGIAIFLGTTRTETSANGATLAALDYEAYTEMAGGQLEALASQARARWPIVRTALLHRIGRVAPAEASVVVAVATPHRHEAFEACRWLIDTLKAQVAVWKREVWSDGSATWVDPGSPTP